MNREDIIRMTREAGFVLSDNATDEAIDRFRNFAALVAAAEREACAKVCEDDALSSQYGERSKYRQLLAAAIRARGQA